MYVNVCVFLYTQIYYHRSRPQIGFTALGFICEMAPTRYTDSKGCSLGDVVTWEFPKIGDPNIVHEIVGSLL